MLPAHTNLIGVEQDRLRRRRWLLAGGTLLMGCAFIALFVVRGLEIHRLRSELLQLETERAKILQEIEALSARLKEAQNDLKLIEYLARKELGMVKPGEEVYIIVEDREER
jgi:cell division protein FtsB